MTTLKIYNGAELAANDHVEHFKMTRQQFSPKKRLTGQLSSSSDKSSGSCAFSSGQESKTSSSDNLNGSDSMCSLDRDTMDRCMQWLKGLPTKFSAIHVQWTPVSENFCNYVSSQHFAILNSGYFIYFHSGEMQYLYFFFVSCLKSWLEISLFILMFYTFIRNNFSMHYPAYILFKSL